MRDVDLGGPSITYVTDEGINRADQERILTEFISSAGVHSLRVAFRLPDWSDSQMQSLIEWYLNTVNRLGMQNELEPPLIHDRPGLSGQFPGCNLWLPWRNRDLFGPEDVGRVAISVHSVWDAHEAIGIGAGELVYGHVFTSESHPGQPGRGVKALTELVESTQIYQNPPRVTAIGGIDEHTISEIGRSAHLHVASMRAISRSPNIAATLNHLRSGWVAARINTELDVDQRTPFGNPSSLFF